MKNKNLRSNKNWRVLGLLLALAVVIIGNSQNTVQAQKLEPELLGATRSFNCSATISLTSSTYSYTIQPFRLSRGITIDREKACLEEIKKRFIDSGEIWKLLGIPAAQQNSYCQSGGQFRIDYGFDSRPKEWQFTTVTLKPPCRCASGMIFP